MRKQFFAAVLVLCVVGGFFGNHSVQAVQATSHQNLSELVKALLTDNPEIRSVMEEVNAARYRVPIEASLDDPQFSVEAMDIATRRPMAGQTPMDGVQLYLMQAVPFPGKRKLKKQLATLRVSEMNEGYAEKINEIVARFKMTYFDSAYAAEAIAINEHAKHQLLSVKQILESRYASGGQSLAADANMSSSAPQAPVSQSDILKTSLEIADIDKELISLRQDQKRDQAKLNQLLNRPIGTPISIKPPSPVTRLPALADILEVAKTHRPSIKRAKINAEEGALEHRLAKKSLLPDFNFRVGYRLRSFNGSDPNVPENFLSTGMDLNIPLWAGQKQKNAIAEARSLQKSREHMRTATEREVLADVEAAYADLEEMKEQVALYRARILPTSQANLASVRQNYEIAATDYRDVLMSQNTLFESERMLASLRYGYEKKIAELEMIIGAPLSPAL